MYKFITGKKYTKKDIYPIIGLPIDTKGGNWDTGYARYGNDFFLFCNIGIPGRTGHDYDNKFIGDDLVWYAKNNTNINQPTIKKLINPEGYIYIFYRRYDKAPFTYAGTAIPKSYLDTTPVQITWSLSAENPDTPNSNSENKKIFEGARKKVLVNIYERDPSARNDCLEVKGYKCSVCNFEFKNFYGELGANFIHVHHLIPLGEIKEEYEIDPVKDLEPVCPNCHAMIHKRRPALSINELKKIISETKLNGNSKKVNT